jgi:hypothetical protein
VSILPEEIADEMARPQGLWEGEAGEASAGPLLPSSKIRLGRGLALRIPSGVKLSFEIVDLL